MLASLIFNYPVSLPYGSNNRYSVVEVGNPTSTFFILAFVIVASVKLAFANTIVLLAEVPILIVPFVAENPLQAVSVLFAVTLLAVILSPVDGIALISLALLSVVSVPINSLFVFLSYKSSPSANGVVVGRFAFVGVLNIYSVVFFGMLYPPIIYFFIGRISFIFIFFLFFFIFF